MQVINITIKKDGTMDYKVEGVKGGACKDVTKFIDKLGSAIVSSEKTGEFCETEQAPRERYTQGGGEG